MVKGYLLGYYVNFSPWLIWESPKNQEPFSGSEILAWKASCDSGLLSTNDGLLWGIVAVWAVVAQDFGQLGLRLTRTLTGRTPKFTIETAI